MTHEEEIKCDLITEVLTIIHNHTQRNYELKEPVDNTAYVFIFLTEYDQMIREIEDLR